VSSIDKKLTAQVVFWSLLIGLLFSAVQMVLDYRTEQQRFRDPAARLLDQAASSVALGLYNYDRESIQASLTGIIGHPGMVGAAVHESATEFSVEQGVTQVSGEVREFRTPLFEPQPDGTTGRQIGRLSIFADEHTIHAGFEQRATVAVLTDIARYTTLAVVLLIMFRRKLTGPIKRLTSRLLEVDVNATGQPDIEVEETLQNTELDDLTAKVRDLLAAMRQEVEQRKVAEHTANQLNEQLEEKVVARTRELNESNVHLQTSLDQLQKMQDLLLQSQRMASIGHLAAGVAHEINNPVAVVYSNIATLSEYLTELIGLADEYRQAEDKIVDQDLRASLERMRELIDLGFVKEDGPELIQASEHSLERVRNIVAELRTFADSGELPRESMDLGSLLKDVIRESGIGIDPTFRVVTVIEKMPPVDVVPSQVRMILAKILQNAVEAMPEGGTIEIASEQHEDSVWLVVKDSGVGMDAQALANAVNPFYSSKDVGEGTGLGLTVAYNLMLNQGGELNITSEPDQGTVVTMKFPRDNVLF